MERGWIEAHGDSEVRTVVEDQFQWRRRLGDLMSHHRLQGWGADMDRQEGGWIDLTCGG